MKFVVGAMVIVFALSAFAVVRAGFEELRKKLRARERLVRVEGVILRFSVRASHLRDHGHHRSRRRTPTRYKFPVVSFTRRDGSQTTFESPFGDAESRSKYAVGQTLPVAYDPLGEIDPMIGSWAGMYFVPVMMMFGGMVFGMAACAIGAVYGSRILGV